MPTNPSPYPTELPPPALRRFWSFVDKTADCWLWKRPCRPYGRFVFAGRQYKAHRLAYALTFGAFEWRLEVCHQCDVPPCVNPAHLFLGTHAVNMDDARRKGRIATGLARPNVIWTPELVLDLRERYAAGCYTQDELAAEYGKRSEDIAPILVHRTWKGVGGPRVEQAGRRALAKLTKQTVLALRHRYAAGGVSMSRLARDYGVSIGVVHSVIHRKTWRDV